MLGGETIAAIATPPGVGGIAVIRISGDQAIDVASRVFRPKNSEKTLDKCQGYTALYGGFAAGDALIDDGIALVFRAPHSYTGEDVVELSCHGGGAVSREVLAACVAAGARPALPGEFTRRAVLGGRMDLTQAEAVMALIDAESRLGAASAKAVLAGSLQREINEIKSGLIALAGHLAACIDYPEEDVEELTVRDFAAQAGAALGRLERLIAGFDRGALVRRGVQAAIVGSPNVGKSTIFNLLSGFERAIVTPVAGTTRDVLREQIHVGGIVLHLADTAGLHETDDVVENEGIRRSYDELDKVNLIMAVFDASESWDDGEIKLAKKCAEKSSVAILNKSDLGEVKNPELIQDYFDEIVIASAHAPETRGKIEDAVLKVLHLEHYNTDAPMLTSQRQLRAVCAARDALKNSEDALKSGLELDAAGVCLEEALAHLAELTGENASEEVVNEVFSSFCVGK